jgi:hypothetical protein
MHCIRSPERGVVWWDFVTIAVQVAYFIILFCVCRVPSHLVAILDKRRISDSLFSLGCLSGPHVSYFFIISALDAAPVVLLLLPCTKGELSQFVYTFSHHE